MKPDLTDNHIDVANIVKIHNFAKNETREAKGSLKKDEEYVFHLQFYVKDFSNALTNSFVKVVLCERSQ